MELQENSEKPLYKQIADWIEEEILAGRLASGEKVHSQYQLADIFTINPATAGKGLTLLIDEKILFKKRGLGTFVSEDAYENILAKRKSETLAALITKTVLEAGYLQVEKEELIDLICREYQKLKEDK